MLGIGNAYKYVDRVHGLGVGSNTEMFHTIWMFQYEYISRFNLSNTILDWERYHLADCASYNIKILYYIFGRLNIDQTNILF